MRAAATSAPADALTDASSQARRLPDCAHRGDRHRCDGFVRRRSRDHGEDDPARRHGAALGSGVRVGRPRRGRLLQVRERTRRRQRPLDRLHGRRRRLEPDSGCRGDAAARRGGRRLRDRQLGRHRRESGDAGLSERAEGAAALRRLRGEHASGASTGAIPPRSAFSRATGPREGSTAPISPARSLAPGSASSSRTTRTAGSCWPDCARGSAAPG